MNHRYRLTSNQVWRGINRHHEAMLGVARRAGWTLKRATGSDRILLVHPDDGHQKSGLDLGLLGTIPRWMLFELISVRRWRLEAYSETWREAHAGPFATRHLP